MSEKVKIMGNNVKMRVVDCSIIIACYSPDLEKLKKTINSVRNQRKVNYEIIIADDGSDFDYKTDIENWLNINGVKNYKLSFLATNQGTIQNIFSALLLCNGEYVKIISPGDLLISDHILYDWLEALRSSGKTWSFGDAVYYKLVEGEPYSFSTKAHPQIVKHYIKKNDQASRWNYFVLSDIALGAAIICKLEIMKKYLQMIVGKIKYAEDNMYRIMMFEGETAFYYAKDVVLYEYGEGISTSNNKKWIRILSDEWRTVDKIICSGITVQNDFQRKMINSCEHKYSNNIFAKILSKINIKSLILKLKLHFFPRKTKTIGKGVFTKIK